MDVIRTVGLTKAYGGRPVVDSLDLAVRRGSVYGFVGRNGAGKSTAMKMLCGMVLPTAGEIELFGERQAPGTTSRRVGAVIESPGIHPGLTGLDNAMYRALALGVPDARAACREALDLVGLGEVMGKRAKTYSLGMKQRLGLAMALVGSPDLLLLDEPFNGLDPQGVREVRTLVMRLVQARGITVFISSHVIDQLERMVTDYGVIRAGRLVRTVTADEVAAACADYLLVRCDRPPLALSVLTDAFPQARFAVMEDDAVRVEGGVAGEAVGRVLADAGIAVAELRSHSRDIEEYFVELMGDEPVGGSSPAKGGGRRA